MKLLIQPGDGVSPIVKSIAAAKKSIEIVIFRFDRREIETALANAVTRGVSVTALIAHTNKAGEARLRRLEMRLLGAGVTVSRTADDYVRYHAKLMIIDRRELHVLAFNFTTIDIDRSRSFGIVTRNSKLVREAVALFEADTKRNPYDAKHADFVVSPSNARKQLTAFIKAAKKSLLIYDLEVSDPEMVKLIDSRAKAGVDVRLIGSTGRRRLSFPVGRCTRRLHTRTIIRDGKIAFLGSQSLRQAELDQRREVGVIIRDAAVVAALGKTFESDWKSAVKAGKQAGRDASVPTDKAVKKVAKAVGKSLPQMGPVLEAALKEVSKANDGLDMSAKDVEEDVREAVKEAVRTVVSDAVGAAVKERNDAAEAAK